MMSAPPTPSCREWLHRVGALYGNVNQGSDGSSVAHRMPTEYVDKAIHPHDC